VLETTTPCIRDDDASDLIIDHCCAMMACVTTMVISHVVPALFFFGLLFFTMAMSFCLSVCLFVSLLPMRSCQLLADWRSSVLVLVPMTGCIIAALPTAPVFVCGPLTSTWPYLRCDVGLEAGEYWKKTVSIYSIVYYYNSAQSYEQFLQVGRLYRALILLGLAFCLSSTSVSSVFLLLYILLFTF